VDLSNETKITDLTSRRRLTLRDVQRAAAAGATRVRVAQGCVVTPSARNFLRKQKIALEAGGAARPRSASRSARAVAKRLAPADARLFSTPEAEAVKKEICAVGKKLWMRQFVDGNGGNISYRIGANEVLCTPTLVSKYDLTPEILCLVDLEGNQVAGIRPQTSELLLHLEIYKAVPEAKAVVHCHPPRATAYAITGKVPPNLIVPEFEVFVGKVAVAPYETPGTKKFAETVLPYVRQHNTVLLANHGIVCWADTVTHAEWYAEVLETYCWTLMLAAQMGAPISYISEQQGADLLAIKKELGLPDPRLNAPNLKECRLSNLVGNEIAPSAEPSAGRAVKTDDADLEALVRLVTETVIAKIGFGK
jgi:L-fuculose-phosphate aldolase